MGNHFKIAVCRGPSCGDKRNSSELRQEFDRLLASTSAQVEMGWQSCFGRCTKGPNVLVREISDSPPQLARTFVLATPPSSRAGRATMYNHVTLNDVSEIVREHLQHARPVQRLAESSKRNILKSEQEKFGTIEARRDVAEKDGDS